jgi:hypothetical protein
LNLNGNDISVLPSTLPTWTGYAYRFESAGLSSSEVDDLLNIIYTPAWGGINIYIGGTNEPRTNASDTNVDYLLNTGYIALYVNETPNTITDIDTDEIITITQTGVVLTGTGFRATQGTGSIILANNATLASATVTSTQTITSWTDTSTIFSVVPGSLATGTVYAFITNKYGGVNATGFAVTLTE